MRRAIFFTLGILEVIVAAVLVYFLAILPGPADVEKGVGRLQSVTRQASAQVGGLGDKMRALSERQPELHRLAARMRTQTQGLAELLRNHVVNFDTLQAVGDALGEVAQGMDGFAETLKPDGIQGIGSGLLATADFLEKNVAGQAEKSAAQLEKSVALLKDDAERLKVLTRDVSLDLQATRDVYQALGRVSQGMDQLRDAFKDDSSIEAMREGFKGLEGALNQGADQVERLANYTYPVVKFNGLQPMIEQKPFWPEGGKIAEDMRKAAKGTAAAGKELENIASQALPKVRSMLADSRRVVEKTHEALGQAVKNREKLEPVLKSGPENAARLAEELPRLGNDLARVLRDTGQLKEVAAMLRQAEKHLTTSAARWPDLQKNLSRSATLLRTTQAQLKQALGKRKDYEASLKHTDTLVRSFSAALPLFTDQLEVDLTDQEQSLHQLRTSIDEVSNVLPEAGTTAARVLSTSRLLLGLVACIFFLHGAYLTLGLRQKPHPTPDAVGARSESHPTPTPSSA
jgi:uncharacterized phage infection (PIP) family protein YhgE